MMEITNLVPLFIPVVFVIVWLVRLEGRVNSVVDISKENKTDLSTMDGHIRILQTDSILVARSLTSMESELRQIKDFIMTDGFSKLKDGLVSELVHELKKAI